MSDCRSWNLEHFIEPALKVCRKSCRILEANAPATSRYGYSRGEWQQLSLLALHPPDEHPAVKNWIEPPQKPPRRFTHLTRTGETLSIQLNVVAPSGQRETQAIVLIQDAVDHRGSDEAHPDLLAACEPVANGRLGALESVKSLTNSNRLLRKLFDQLITVLGAVVACRDPYTADHQVRVAGLSEAIGRYLGLDPHTIEGLRIASLLHDIGKLTIPAELLSKPGPLSNVQRSLVHSHALAGYEILRKIDFPWPIAEVVLQHHERIDGSGYPDHLAGSDILVESRIVAVADTLDAMTSHRPYRPALGVHRAVAEICAGSGSKYDSRVVGACLALQTKSRLFAND